MRIMALGALLLLAGCAFREERGAVSTAPDPCAVRGWSTTPEAVWVREIVEAAGYQVLAETGSAWVASGKGHEFFIWATELRRPSRGMPNWRRLARVRGVPIYGDRDVWRSWRAQGFTFWVQAGPRPVFAPAAGRLAPVVDASLRIPFRDPCA